VLRKIGIKKGAALLQGCTFLWVAIRRGGVLDAPTHKLEFIWKILLSIHQEISFVHPYETNALHFS